VVLWLAAPNPDLLYVIEGLPLGESLSDERKQEQDEMKNTKSMSLPELTFQGGTKAAGKVFSLVKPRLAGLTHTLFKPVQTPSRLVGGGAHPD
jgi:hypothetical protein